MRATWLAALALVASIATTAHAQIARPLTEAQRRGTGDTSIFAPLDLPPGNIYRSGSGAPGPKYWQQRVDYLLRGTLDTAAKSLQGEETIRYTNNSPDTLRYVWLQVEQNAFKSGSLNSFVFPSASRFGARNFEGGDVIDHLDQTTARGKTPLKSRVEGTMMKVDLAGPLAPGATVTLSIGWHFNIPEHGADRMGRDGALYELAQWYPRVAVYDDLRGWNTEPYLGQGEFYLEYGNFELYVTVPAGYIVAATGSLLNPSEVLTTTQRTRLARARTSDTTVHIITQEELASGVARPKKTGALTWHFRAENVRDAVWAASPDYLWDASGWNGHMAFAYYRPSAIATWKDAADMSRMSIKEYSERWFEYPWPHISAVEGPISGMEYPMIAMENKSNDKYDLYNVVTHEIGHMWYPMIVGSNERMHMWQDEGFNTFINYFSEALRFPEKGSQTERALSDMRVIEQYFQFGADRPLEINPDRISPALLGENAYAKTAVGLQILRNEIMGPEAFDDAFRTYTARWAFKHPSPADFYRTMEDAGGRRLDWFWREWFRENPVFDQAVDSVATSTKGDTSNVTVTYGNRARGVLPIHARFSFSDGSTENFDYPAEVWSTNSVRYPRQYSFTGKQLTMIEVDPEKRLPDIDRSNNVWRGPGAGAPVAAPRTQ
ncbi:MAG TPA: M1 family metallopeptidase [Gemmatimonadaceae bacterium]|nr:M1 family metallopeptidase [Gemmatimonadaceae bacterium]